MAVYDVNGNLLTDSVSIESYYSNEMSDTVSKVRALQTEPNLTFFLVTDIHSYFVSEQEELYKKTVANMRCLIDEIPCDGVINLGDSIEGYSQITIAQEYGNNVMNEFRKIPVTYYSVIGNHDDNRYHSSSGQRLTNAQRYQLIVNPTRKVVFASDGLSYYVDFPEHNIRMICLDGVADYTYKFTTDTCTWFSGTALNTPTGYGVIVNAHISPFSAWNYNNTNPTNGSTIKTALDTYAESKDVIAVLCGHNHVDATFSSPHYGATICCEKFENENGDPNKWPTGSVKPQRTAKTASEDCWDVVVIRPTSRKINFVRFGAGSDREISY